MGRAVGSIMSLMCAREAGEKEIKHPNYVRSRLNEEDVAYYSLQGVATSNDS